MRPGRQAPSARLQLWYQILPMHNEQHLPPPHMCWAEYGYSERFLQPKGLLKTSEHWFSWWVQAQRREAWAQSHYVSPNTTSLKIVHRCLQPLYIYNNCLPQVESWFHSATRFSDQCSVIWVIHKTFIKNSVRSWEKSEIIAPNPPDRPSECSPEPSLGLAPNSKVLCVPPSPKYSESNAQRPWNEDSEGSSPVVRLSSSRPFSNAWSTFCFLSWMSSCRTWNTGATLLSAHLGRMLTGLRFSE